MSHRLKILHIISSWENGVSYELAEFVARLSRDDFACEIGVLANSNTRSVGDIPITTLNHRWTFDVSTYLGVARHLQRFRPDVVHTWDAVAQCYGTLHYGNQRVLAEKRETDVPQGRGQKYLDKKAHRLIAPKKIDHCSKTVIIPPAAVPVPNTTEPISAERLLEKLCFPAAEPSGDYYPVRQQHYDPARRSYKPSPHHATPFLIGIVLPLCSEHNILDAFWVFETLHYVHLNFHAFVIGDGKDRELFLRHRDHWKLFSRVHCLAGHHDAYWLLPHFDALLHLSPSAEYSGTILSAMSCGVPVVALETPESREYIADGTTGILIPDEGDHRFYRRTAVKRLLHLLENEELRHSMRKAAQECVMKNYNFDTATQRRINVYHNLPR